MKSRAGFLHLAFMLVVGCGLGWTAPATAQPLPADVITVGTVSAAGPVIDVPIHVRDVSTTPLGIDQPVGSRIQSFSIKVDYTVSAFITSVTFTRAGITQSLTPTFTSSPSSPGTITLLVTFDETSNLVPFVSNAAAPGNQVGRLTFTFSNATPPGTVIPLTLDATLTQLSNEGGTVTETVANGRLTLVPGSVTVLARVAEAPIPTLGTWALAALAIALATVVLRRI